MDSDSQNSIVNAYENEFPAPQSVRYANSTVPASFIKSWGRSERRHDLNPTALYIEIAVS